MFQTRCFFPGPRSDWLAAVRREYDLVLALDTGPGADNLFTYRPPQGKRIALLVGNERRGLSRAARGAADELLQIPMRQEGVRSLNVASAAAVALSQLVHRAGRLPPARGR